MKAILKAQYHVLIRYMYMITQRTSRNKIKKQLHILLNNRDVLIVGSGPSAEYLSNISLPTDILILTTNLSPLHLPSFKEITLYITSKESYLQSSSDIVHLLKNTPIKLVLSDMQHILAKKCDNHISFNPRDTNFLHALLKKKLSYLKNLMIKISTPNQHLFLSSGLQLLQYAIMGNARHIYLIGIDPSETVTHSKKSTYKTPHLHPQKNNHYIIDTLFLTHCANLHPHIYSVSKTSSLTQYLPYKSIQNSLPRKQPEH